ncbi:unnamed protein product [Brassicogethes aeneus]|uniref:Apolipoprotein D n=1 Tax=Brassicogethes aeneus TaxID=1431903 RepID=A0A9P0AXA6_BRAAE|nr:unnamed protein product [Brassicogethes aeneus]
MKKFFAIFLLFLSFHGGEFHSYHLGSCPNIEPMREFNMDRMLGIWYVMEKTSTASSCITYNFTKTDEPGEYRVEQVSQHFLLGLTPLKHGYHYTGILKVPDSSIPAKMTVKFPLSVAGTASFTVFTTDYDTFAGIYSCQTLTTIGNRQSATILSRTRTLDKMYSDKIRSKLTSFHVDPFDLSIIKQTECPRNLTDSYNINIDDETISAKNAAGIIRKAGEKIGDGVEYISGKTQQVYHKIADKSEGEKDRVGRIMTANPNSEWLP